MTLTEAILKSLEEFKKPVSANEIGVAILQKKYWDTAGATPLATIQSRLGDFIRNNDSRVKRMKENGVYFYYLTKNEQIIEDVVNSIEKQKNKAKLDTYKERDLHKLLSTYLKNESIYSKTIYHEESNRKDDNQMWTHPDIVGICLLRLQHKVSQNFLKKINQLDSFKLTSYELKKEINNDSELKKAYFQAVSNSSWANYGYLVAFEISDSLREEMERLNQSFGIGIIVMNANPYQSKILFQAKYKELDFKTIDKLCKINENFAKFIELSEKVLTAEEKYSQAIEKELNEFCDDYFKANEDEQIEQYCKDKNIPIDIV
jgi:hypothetical protein